LPDAHVNLYNFFSTSLCHVINVGNCIDSVAFKKRKDKNEVKEVMDAFAVPQTV